MSAPERTGSAGRRWVLAVVWVLVIPAVAFAVAAAVPAKYQGDLVTAVEQDVGRPLTSAERSRIDITAACLEPDLTNDQVCGDLAIAGATRTLAAVGGVIGLALLLVLAILRVRTRRDRDALLRLFRPGLYVTLGGLVALVAVDGIIAIAAVYLGLGVLLGRIYPFLILAIAVGVLLSVVGIIRAALRATRNAVAEVVARRLDPTEQPALDALVRDIARSVGTEPPDQILVGLDPSFFVTEAEVEATDGRWRGRSLYLSLPLSRIVTVPELRGIIGHEMGHFRGMDTVYSQRFYPIYRGASDAIASLRRAGGGSGARSLALIPAAAILGLFIEEFATAERAISRDRELAADQAGAGAASARALASSLVKLTAFTPCWGSAMDGIVGAARGGPALTNAGDAFVAAAHAAARPDVLSDLDRGRIPHPIDTHPPLTVRLAGLGIAESAVSSEAIDVDPSAPAADLIRDRSAIETSLTSWLATRISASVAKAGGRRTARRTSESR